MIKGFLSRFLTALTLAASIAITPAAVTDGLVSHWQLNEITPQNTAPDAVGQNHFDVIGAPTVEAGQDGNAIRFNGSSTYLIKRHDVDRTTSGGLPIYTAGAYTISMWVKGAAQTARYLFAEGNTNATTTSNPLLILQTGQAAGNNAKFDVIIRNDANTTLVNHAVSDAVVFDDSWHHITWVDDNGAVRLYVDAVRDIANFNYTPAGAFTFNNTTIATLVRTAVSTGAIFNGLIDDVKIWERALTEEEVYEVVPDIAPTIKTEPADVTRANGDWARFTVAHTGTGPFTYKWFKNGIEIQGATSRSYQTAALTPGNTGELYSVQISNAAGSVTSREAKVTVTADPAADVRASLVNYWPLDTIDSANSLLTSEDVYSGNDMVLIGFSSPTDVVPGKFGNALEFDGARYTYRTNGAPIYNSTNYSVSMWVKADFTGQNDRRVFSEGSPTDNDPLFTLGTDNTGATPSATVFVRSDTAVNTAVVGKKSTRPVFDNLDWHHLVWTDANGQGRLYIDGVLDETDYTYARPTLTLSLTSLGAVLRAGPTQFYIGSIDEVATWKRVLSWTEIQSIMTNGVPQPISIIAPAIVTQPANRTNNVFAGDNVQFTVQASGTVPLTYEWYRNNTKIDAIANPTAATDTLVLTNVGGGDSGSIFYVKVTNPAGSAQSDTVGLNVAPYTPPTSGEVLHIDIGLSGSPNVQPGFDEFTLANNGTNYNGVGVTISGIGAALADRNRTTGAMVTNTPPAMTQAQLYNDFIFANNTADGTGLRILIERLAPNTPHAVTIWSFDPQSTTIRMSDWSETSGATPVEIKTGYTFDGAILPVNDNDQTITATLTSSPTGKLQIDAIKTGGAANFGAFVNAIRLVANPGAEPITITQAALVRDKIWITVHRNSTDQQVSLEERADFSTGSWGPSTAAPVSQNGLDITFEAPTTAAKMFFRVISQ